MAGNKKVVQSRGKIATRKPRVKAAVRKIPDDARCFIPERHGNDVYHTIDTQFTPKERKEITRKIPRVMKVSRLLREDVSILFPSIISILTSS